MKKEGAEGSLKRPRRARLVQIITFQRAPGDSEQPQVIKHPGLRATTMGITAAHLPTAPTPPTPDLTIHHASHYLSLSAH